MGTERPTAASASDPRLRVLVCVVVYDRIALVSQWRRAWEIAEKARSHGPLPFQARLAVVHSHDGDRPPAAQRDEILRWKPDHYFPRGNSGLDVGALRDTIHNRSLDPWDVLLWFTDDTLPMRRDFVGALVGPLQDPGIGLVGNYVYPAGSTGPAGGHGVVVRTVAFAIRRGIALRLSYPQPLETRPDTYRFEYEGNDTLAKQVERMGFGITNLKHNVSVPLAQCHEYAWDSHHMGPEAIKEAYRVNLWPAFEAQFPRPSSPAASQARAAKVLFVGQCPTAPTGYGRVVATLAGAFHSAGHEVTVLGLGYSGAPHGLPFRLLACPRHFPEDEIAAAIRQESPELLITVGDPWMFELVPELAELSTVNWVPYFPVDGFPMPKSWVSWLRPADLPIVYSRFTQELVRGATGRTPWLVYHGVDTSTFKPLDKRDCKARVGVAERFVVGTVAANQQRKNLPALVKAFAAFAGDKPDVILYLHTQTAGGFYDLEELSERWKITNQLRVTLGLDRGHGVPDPVLARIYNAFDVLVLPTMAEGFGLPLLESQACGVPAFATDFSSCPELLPCPVQRLRVKDTLVMARNFEQAVVDTDDIIAKLNYFYLHPEELKVLGEQCRQFATGFEWSAACRQFIDLCESLPAKPKVIKPRFVVV